MLTFEFSTSRVEFYRRHRLAYQSDTESSINHARAAAIAPRIVSVVRIITLSFETCARSSRASSEIPVNIIAVLRCLCITSDNWAESVPSSRSCGVIGSTTLRNTFEIDSDCVLVEIESRLHDSALYC